MHNIVFIEQKVKQNQKKSYENKKEMDFKHKGKGVT